MTAFYFLCCLLRPICLPVPETLLVLWGSGQVGLFPALAVGVLGSVAGIASMYLISSKMYGWIERKLDCGNYVYCKPPECTVMLAKKVPGWRSAVRLYCKFNWCAVINCFRGYIAHYKAKIIAMLFIIPVFPDIMISIGAAVIKISLPEFLILAIMAKSVSIGMVVYAGEIAGLLSLEKWQVILAELLFVHIVSYIFKAYNRCKEL